MAMLAREALKNHIFRDICSQSSMKVCFGAPPYDRWLKNTNKLLTMYEGVYGVKTGFTDEAGRCLVSACERSGKDLICVTLNDRNDWEDHISLYDYSFASVRTMDAELPKDLSAEIVGGISDSIRLVPERDSMTVTTAAGNKDDITFTVLRAPFLYAPLKAGDKAAELRISFLGREVETVPLFAAEDVAAAPKKSDSSRKSLFDKIIDRIGRLFSR